ncbi:dihydrolipoyl dehydrogenase family protein [Desulfovibrio litoralis]|uniref:Dihydrolipoyl dehydrogenase n=1 Tax=Desulfovibrio litoralis DSM 11393 TaxID=1121455 RepID=A0A1M7TKA9_9BACT|nr:NAD(P)/FAD-dependent oxidoreductase [Desulfovibrio litoralis]SHN71136.1 dihydrolipoamide dehydrogenase [Desulfovibrio litoralis DSM 11393]
MNCDLAIIGAGAAGIKAAQVAAEKGLKVVLIERGFIGGTCLNSGCVPTKHLLSQTDFLKQLNYQQQDKLEHSLMNYDLIKIQQRKDELIAILRQETAERLEALGVIILKGKANFIKTNKLNIVLSGENQELSFKNAIIATGSAPVALPNIRPDGGSVLASSSIINLKKAPKDLIILGGGAIGIELGSFFHRLGTKIIMVEGRDRIAATEEPTISERLSKQLIEKGWELHIGKPVVSLVTVDDESVLTFADGNQLKAEFSLVAIGRKPLSQGLGLEEIGINLNQRGFIETDENCTSNIPNIYAIGDVNGKIMMAHIAEQQAMIAVNHILKEHTDYKIKHVSSCIYGDIELIKVGNSVAELKTQGKTVQISTAEFKDNIFAKCLGENDAFVQIAWVNDKIASISAIGQNVSHLITQAIILVNKEFTKDDMQKIFLPVPIFDETLKTAILNKRQQA